MTLNRMTRCAGALALTLAMALPVGSAAQASATGAPAAAKASTAAAASKKKARPAASAAKKRRLTVRPIVAKPATAAKAAPVAVKAAAPAAQPAAPAAAPAAPPAATPAAAPAPAAAETPAAGGSGRSWDRDRGSSGATVSIDFRGADINNVLRFFATATGWQIIPDASLTGPVTIISPKQLTVDQAFLVLQSSLAVRGYAGQFEKHGDTTILKIIPLDQATKSTLEFRGADQSPDDLRGQVVTQVIPVQNVDAATMARDLTTLVSKGASIVGSAGTNALVVTDSANNVARISSLVKLLDTTGSINKVEIFALKHADATQLETIVNNIFRQVNAAATSRGGRGGMGGMGGPGMPGMPGGQSGATGNAAGGTVTAVADTRSNSLLVVASEDNLSRVRDLVNKLDSDQVAVMQVRIVKMKYADAISVSDILNSVLSGSVPTSGNQGGGSFFARVFGGGGSSSNRGQSVTSSDPFAKVVADQRTNSLLITATDERMARIDQIITALDVPVKTEATTFVVPLKKAQASDLAQILSQAFGGSSGGYSMYGNQNTNRTNTSTNRTSTTNRNSRTSASSLTGRASTIGGRAAAMDSAVHGTLTAGGFVPDASDPGTADDGAPDSRQFGFPMMGGFSSSSQSSTAQYGRGTGGNQVNLLQFRNNVGVVAEPDSNSLIITTTPDNMTALREIIDNLDTVPRQVMIEVIIAEASLDSTQKLGVQFDASGIGKILGDAITQKGSSNFSIAGGSSTSATIASPLAPGVQYGVQAVSGKFGAVLQALSTDSKVRILSTPKVFASNNNAASIDVTTNVPYVTSSFSGGTSVGSSVQYSFLALGITLDVTPRITTDGHVAMEMSATSSDLLGFDTITSTIDSSGRPSTIQAPRTSQRTTTTTVTAADGEVVVIGGLMRDNKTVTTNKVPVLGDLPFIGTLFRSTATNTAKTELMIFLVPHVVDSDSEARALAKGEASALRHALPSLEREHPQLAPDKPATDAPAGDKPAPTVEGSGARKP